MIHRTHFHCITHGLHALLGEIWLCICLFCGFVFTGQMAPLFNINFYLIARSDCALQFLACMRKYIFAHESFYLQGILNDISEQGTSILDCKPKHMMKSGAPPDKLGVHVLYVYQ